MSRSSSIQRFADEWRSLTQESDAEPVSSTTTIAGLEARIGREEKRLARMAAILAEAEKLL